MASLKRKHDRTYGQTVKTKPERSAEAQEILQKMQMGIAGRDLVNILFVGPEGSGKSSLINSCIMALNTGEYQEIALRGEKDIATDTGLSQMLRRYSIPNYVKLDKGSFKTTVCLFDNPGLPDDDSEQVRSYLDHLISGKLEEGTCFKDWVNFTPDQIEANFHDAYAPENKIDLVCYIHAYGEASDDNLAEAVGATCLNSKREMPVILIITKMDLFDKHPKRAEEFKERKRSVMQKLALVDVDERVFELSLYSKGYMLNRAKHIDAKLCQLWSKLIDPIYCDRATEFKGRRRRPLTTSIPSQDTSCFIS